MQAYNQARRASQLGSGFPRRFGSCRGFLRVWCTVPLISRHFPMQFRFRPHAYVGTRRVICNWNPCELRGSELAEGSEFWASKASWERSLHSPTCRYRLNRVNRVTNLRQLCELSKRTVSKRRDWKAKTRSSHATGQGSMDKSQWFPLQAEP